MAMGEAEPDTMSVREIKEELARLEVSLEGCVEKEDLVQKLKSARSVGRQGAGGGRSGQQDQGMASFMSGLEGSFNMMSDNFAGMMNRITERFDRMDDQLDGLESKREQLRATLDTPAQTPLGRLNKMKAAAGAREVGAQINETKQQMREEREKAREQVEAQRGAK
mmetsp:Transcript_3913/g.7895  ORF Transcript_3913/g.7895 Transcript_3913/m.7895 type:complete len:166 (+) Transcript_3913:213-710(+)|eukprot:CAMPEP_0181290304 /NCGR_PEP_ID=MMETSP1101-20121128/1343_1 /TAXON_ID=46948 /ORGANISM="Rhodomonas abbreviata, Strain Caron Lab Isolate" /LENGTH=165 /DNA_ID=CAMNT_0023394581 /DNA_START=198 /DNA_END=695 /DNA_ORIENTATION=+